MSAFRKFVDWWTKRKTYSDKLREKFAAEIQERASCLFTSYRGQLIPNTEDYPQTFDYAVVTIKIDDMLLRFVRGRMDFRVDITPTDKPGAWREIGAVVKNANRVTNDSSQKIDYYGLNDFGRFFQSNFDTLQLELKNPNWNAPRPRVVPI